MSFLNWYAEENLVVNNQYYWSDGCRLELILTFLKHCSMFAPKLRLLCKYLFQEHQIFEGKLSADCSSKETLY